MNKTLLSAASVLLCAVSFAQTTIYSTGFETLNNASIVNQDGWGTEMGQSPFVSPNFIVSQNPANAKFGNKSLSFNFAGQATNLIGTQTAYRDITTTDPTGTTYVLSSWVRVNAGANNGGEFGIESYGGRGGDPLFLYLDQSLKLRGNGTVVWSRPDPLSNVRIGQTAPQLILPLNTWHFVELRITTGNGVGITKASVNGFDLWGTTPLGSNVNRGTAQIDSLWGIDLLAYRQANTANNSGAFDNVSIKRYSSSQMTIAGRVNPLDISLDGNGNPNIAGMPIRVQLVDTLGQFVAETINTTIDADGYYQVQATFPGDYDVYVKAAHHLGKLAGSVKLDPFARVAPVTVVNGDVDGDNQVSILDYIALSSAYEKSNSDADWNVIDPNTGLTPRASDLDEDGSVSILDYIILSTNYELAGEGTF